MLSVKNQELRHMRSLASSILDQKTEIEQFLLEALNDVSVSREGGYLTFTFTFRFPLYTICIVFVFVFQN